MGNQDPKPTPNLRHDRGQLGLSAMPVTGSGHCQARCQPARPGPGEVGPVRAELPPDLPFLAWDWPAPWPPALAPELKTGGGISPFDRDNHPKLSRSHSYPGPVQSRRGDSSCTTLPSPSTGVVSCLCHRAAPGPLSTVRFLRSLLSLVLIHSPSQGCWEKPNFICFVFGGGNHSSGVLWNTQLVPQFPQLPTRPKLSLELHRMYGTIPCAHPSSR